MNRIKLLMIIFATMQFQSCFIIKRNPVKDFSNHRKDLTYGMSERAKKDWQFYNRLTRYMWDYDVINQLLEDGADPNYKGHPYPFSHKAVIQEKMTGKEAIQYFNSAEATTPLYEAIKKGIDWETQIDLLLKYGATVDKSCIEAAKLSGDQKMMEKIQKLIESKNK